MIKSDHAVLRVKRIKQSRNGAFCIADLTTDFGEFKVKDPMLDQFKEGEYEATVWISEIYLSQYIAYGKAVTEMRARLHDLQVTAENYHRRPSEPVELDPLDEPQPVRLPQGKPKDDASVPQAPADKPADKPRDERWDKFKKPSKGKTEPVPTADAESSVEASQALFDEEMQQAVERREPIKLDRSIDRTRLREQIRKLGEFGYSFDAKTQSFFAK